MENTIVRKEKRERKTNNQVDELKKKILKIIEKEPKSVTEIMKELSIPTKPLHKISKFSQIYLTSLKDNKTIIMLEKTEKNKELLKQRYNKEWDEKLHTYYVSNELGAKFSQIYDEILKRYENSGLLNLRDKKDIIKKVNQIVKLLADFKFLANKELKLTDKEYNERYWNIIDYAGSLRNPLCSSSSIKKLNRKKTKSEIEIINKKRDIAVEKFKQDYIKNYEGIKQRGTKIADMIDDMLVRFSSTINQKRLDEISANIIEELDNLQDLIWDVQEKVPNIIENEII